MGSRPDGGRPAAAIADECSGPQYLDHELAFRRWALKTAIDLSGIAPALPSLPRLPALRRLDHPIGVPLPPCLPHTSSTPDATSAGPCAAQRPGAQRPGAQRSTA